ncbi:MAG: AAA family ATPase [Deltaproteobacteria bacterium]|nr:AAA family ATPase [Deltaproteobacteria bacterium]
MDETNMAAPQPEVAAIPPNLTFEKATTKHIDHQDFQEHPSLQNPFPQVIKISRYTKDTGPLTKVMRLVDGTLCKDGSGCRMNRGKVEQCSIGSMSELAFLLQSLGLNQAVSLGVTDSDSVKTITTRDKETGNAISRTKRHILFRPNEPAFMLFDHDQSRDNAVFADAKAGKGYRPEILMEIVADLFPPIRHVSWLMRPSTSACIYDQSGNLLKGEGSGFHIYFPVKDGSDIPRFIEVMGKRLILVGYGRIEFSRSGQMLARTLVDLLVGSPERLVFEAGALCEDGLVQRLPMPRINEGAVLDTHLLPSLSVNESQQYENIVNDLKTLARSAQENISAQYIITESEKLVVSQSCSHAEAEKIIRTRQMLQLADDDFLFFQHASGPVSVQDMLNEGATFNNRCLADPLEPEYDGNNKGKAIFYWNNGKNPIIKSFAHGERIYSFRRYEEPRSEDNGQKKRGQQRPVGFDIKVFLEKDFPPRTNLLVPWLPSQGLAMVYAKRGIGKTFFALNIAFAVASGGSYLGWQAPVAAGVLYLDGEMPAPAMQERLAAIAKGSVLFPIAPLILVNPDFQPEGMPRIDQEDGQKAIESILTDEIKLIVVDNISTLSCAKENEADGWAPVQGWALRQRASGRSVLFVHHAGKGGAQRGTSRREDVLDTVIALRHPAQYQQEHGAVFEVHFEKNRGLYGDEVKPFEATLHLGNGQEMSWSTRSIEQTTLDKVVTLFNEGVKQNDIAEELRIDKSNVSRHVKKARESGLLDREKDDEGGKRLT